MLYIYTILTYMCVRFKAKGKVERHILSGVVSINQLYTDNLHAMKLLSLVSAYCVVAPFLLAVTCGLDCVDTQRSLDRFSLEAQVDLQPLLLQRKLGLKQDAVVKCFVDANMAPNRKLLLQAPSGKKQEEKVILHHGKQTGTWREWIESPNKSDFFTMDYHWVRRRRPIHNKHYPSHHLP